MHFYEPPAANLFAEMSIVSIDAVGRWFVTEISVNGQHVTSHSLSSSSFDPTLHLNLRSCSSNEINYSDLEFSTLKIKNMLISRALCTCFNYLIQTQIQVFHAILHFKIPSMRHFFYFSIKFFHFINPCVFQKQVYHTT